MVYLLTYDGYMREEYLEEICPSAILFMQCDLKDCALEFRRFYETAMPTLEVGDEIVPAVIWKIEETDLQNMELIYPNEIYEREVWNFRTEKDVLKVTVFLMRETPFAFPKEKEWTIVNKKDTIFKYIFWERLDSLPIPECCFHFVWCQIA